MILIPEQPTRVNDRFLFDDSIEASPLRDGVISSLIPGQPNDDVSRFQAEFYKNFALDIVTETVLNYPYPAITEKTLRPIACKRMFVVIGPPNVLHLLHQKGFQTFGDFINEDYDTIIDPQVRFKQAVQSVTGFMSMPLDNIKQYYKQNQPKFEHNFSILKHLQSTELQQIASQLSAD
jgi:hypothetical protein